MAGKTPEEKLEDARKAATDIGVVFNESTPIEDLVSLTKEKKQRMDLIEKALALNINFTDETTNDDLAKLIKEYKPEVKPKVETETSKKKELIIRDVNGNDVKQSDYFFAKDGKSDTAPAWFNKSIGYPVEREELLKVFNNVFPVSKGLLFYKQWDKEVYLIIVPIKYSSIIGEFNDSEEGDYQRHAISFIGEGSVNLDTLRQKLTKVASTINLTDK